MNRLLFMQKKLFVVFVLLLAIYACSASTGSRYEKDKKANSDSTSEQKNTDVNLTTLKEDFDISPYKTKIVVPDKKINSITKNQNVWFDYTSPVVDTKMKTLVGTSDGFRVLVITTDNIEEANQIKTDVYFSQNSIEVYIDFEPPFYKVKSGDFDNQKTADEMRFKLNQLGYKEAKVIKDKINIYK